MASQEELEWWNKFADVMAEQWMLTPRLNAMIRSEYERDYADYLFSSKGRLLEIGCGVGWIGQKFAKRGMRVDGIDFSENQLEIARRLAQAEGLEDVAYFRRDLVNDPLTGRFETYDAILVNAVLHHLSAQEVEDLMARIAAVLAPGGRLYIYEPLSPKCESAARRAIVMPIDFAVRAILFGITQFGRTLHLFKENFADAIRRGYTGVSPDEGPIPVEALRGYLVKHGLSIVHERPFHNYSLAVAMSIVRLRPRLQSFATNFVPAFYWLDAVLFKSIGWRNFGDDRTVLCALKVTKRVDLVEPN